MDSIQGKPISTARQRFLFDVNMVNKKSEKYIDEASNENPKPSLYLELDQEKLYFGCTNGSILINAQSSNYEDMIQAPTEGYVEKIDISETLPNNSFTFYLKTSTGKYGKGEVTSIYFSEDKSNGTLDIVKFAFQHDGMRI